jgi:Ca2+-transporting ATPase
METGAWSIPATSAVGTTMAFFTISMAEIFHSLNMRSLHRSIFTLGSHNWLLTLSAALALLLSTLVCEVPAIAAVFSFAPLTLAQYAISVGLALLVIPVVEIVKLCERRARAKEEKNA